MDTTLIERVNYFINLLHERKANNVIAIDVRDKCNFTEYLIISTGTATMHNKSIAEYVLDKSYDNKIQVLSIEGMDALTWILIDLNDIIVHIFTEETFEKYNLEDLWTKRNIIPGIKNEN